MAKARSKTTNNAGVDGAGDMTNEPATAKDAAAAAKLPASPLSPVRKVTTTFVDLLANGALQSNLERIEGQLKAFKNRGGISVASALALANEGKRLTAVADRLDNSVARVHQRIVQINGQLRDFQTWLAQCATNAADGSDVATVLGPFAQSRASALGKAKAAKTKNKRAKAKSAAQKTA